MAHSKLYKARQRLKKAKAAERDWNRMLDQAGEVQYGARQRDAEQAARDQAAYDRTLDQAYDLYKSYVSGAQAGQNDTMAKIRQGLTDAQASAAGLVHQGASQASDRAASDAALYGQSQSNVAAAASQGQAAERGIQKAAEPGSVSLAAQQFLHANDLAVHGAIGERDRIEAHKQNFTRTQLARQRAADLKGERAAWQQTYGADLKRQDQRDRLSAAALGLKQDQFDALNADREADNARQDAALEERKRHNTVAEGQAAARLAKAAKKGTSVTYTDAQGQSHTLTRSQVYAWKKQKGRIDQARALYRSLGGQWKKDGKADTGRISAYLRKQYGFKTYELNAARDLFTFSALSRQNYNRLKSEMFGIVPGGYYAHADWR